MEIKELKSWEDFEKEIEKLFSSVDKWRAKSGLHVSVPLFRGQSNGDWRLETTLDRIKKGIRMSQYHTIMQSIKSQIESYTDMRWQISKFEEPKGGMCVILPQEEYAFMIYLRHHKFPSPLLDWTRSPYIAIFFAFNDFQLEKDVAIFAYIEYLGHGKSGSGKDPSIYSLGPNVTTHKRHHLQQSEYTICTKRENDEKHHYWDHEEVFNKAAVEQDLLKKYILPYSEKTKVLKKLDLMNINAYSLFDTEESLMHTLTIREFL